MGCLDPLGLAQVFQEPSLELRADLDRHIDGCAACRSLVAAYARLQDDADTASGVTVLAATAPIPRAGTPDTVGQVVAGRYRLERVVGEGGMGVVWAAFDLLTGREVALKKLKTATSELSRRFEREARVGQVIGHPNVLEIRAALSLPDGTTVIVMDLLHGRSLASDLAVRGPLPIAETLSIMVPLASAVRAAHAKGVVHRDLKPGNVFLATDDDAQPPVVMLLDFGLAKILTTDDGAAEKLTRTGALLGTPHYMAPEQLVGEPAGPAADVWALAVITFECLTGKRPLEGRTMAQLVRSATTGNIARLPATARIAPLVNRMLASDPAARPAMSEVHAVMAAP